MQGIKKGVKKAAEPFVKESTFLPGVIKGTEKILKSFKDRKKKDKTENLIGLEKLMAVAHIILLKKAKKLKKVYGITFIKKENVERR